MAHEKQNIALVFGQAVRRVRLSQNLSQEKLAERSGLHRTYIGDVERAARNVTLQSASRIAQALGVALADLVSVGDDEADH